MSRILRCTLSVDGLLTLHNVFSVANPHTVTLPTGYANRQLLPISNGFDHFYGFYQGAIDYVTKSYNDIENGDVGIYDFWEDGEPKYDVIDSDINTMTLYSQQIQMYIETESHKQKEVLLLLSSEHSLISSIFISLFCYVSTLCLLSIVFSDAVFLCFWHFFAVSLWFGAQERNFGLNPAPFYLYFAVQSMHVPFPDITEFDQQCWDLVKHDASNREYKRSRRKYCALLLLTDLVIGELISNLKANELWDNTLVVFTSDNGGETARVCLWLKISCFFES